MRVSERLVLVFCAGAVLWHHFMWPIAELLFEAFK